MEKIIIFIIPIVILGLTVLFFSNQKQTPTPESVVLTVFPTPSTVPNTITPTTILTTQNPVGPKEVEKITINATIKTSKGNIILTLFKKESPNTVDNFVKKSKSGFYDNLTFHRVEDWVIQGGDPKGNGTGGGNMATELNNLPFEIGSLGIARGGDIKISNDAQFFITKTKADWLNGQYTNFGIVKEGMDVVSKIEIGDKILGITTD